MTSAIMPSKNQALIAAYVRKCASPSEAPMLAKLREIELARREIVDGCAFGIASRQKADAKFRKYFEDQLRQ